MVEVDMKGELFADFDVRHSSGFLVSARLVVERGRTVALLGPNGAGKSTIVDVIAGLLPIASGSVAFDGAVWDDPASGVFVPPDERRVGVVFQDGLLFGHMTVRENVDFGPRSLRWSASSREQSVAQWLHRLDLDDLADRRPAELSGGERQRVAMARALVTEPDVLILDEPLTAVDAEARPHLRRLLGEYLDAFAGAAIVITHDAPEAFMLADQVVILESGVITHEGSPTDIRLRPATAYAAEIAGVNIVHGVASQGVLRAGRQRLQLSDSAVSGPVVAIINPTSIQLHRNRPEGSARNVWETTVVGIEPFGDTVRVATSDPFGLTVEVTNAGASDTGIAVGGSVWVSIKATEIRTTLMESADGPQMADGESA
jgi:molybdate transport system ATP-binding protein